MLEPIRSCVEEALRVLAQEELGALREVVQALRAIDFEASILRLRAERRFENPTVLARVSARLEALLFDRLGTRVSVRILSQVRDPNAKAQLFEHASNRPVLHLFEHIASGSETRHRLVYIHGAPGTGKTFLVERALAAQLTTPVQRYDALAYHSDFVARQRGRSLLAWRRELVQSSVFILDEVHRLSGKPRTQLELCSLLEGLRSRKALAILVGRHHPRGIRHLTPALESRLLGGLTHEVQVAPQSVREAFALANGVSETEVELLSDLTLTPRSFGEILRRVACAREGSDHDHGVASSDGRSDFLEHIVHRVADAFACEVDALRGPQSTRRHSLPRHVVVFVARRAGISGAEMARRLGWSSASSASYAVRHVEDRMRDDPDFRRVVQSII